MAIDPFFGAIGAGLLQGGGSLLGGMMGASGQEATNAKAMAFARDQQEDAQAFNSGEARANRDWQQWMSDTAHQREVNDLRAAGLNPILAARLGGASSGGGGAASSGAINATLGNPGSFTGAGVSSAAGAAARAAEVNAVLMSAKKDKSQTELNAATENATKANEALTQELNTKAKQDTATSAAQQHGINTTAANTQADTINKGIQSMILSHDATTAFQKSRLAKAEADQAEKHGPGPAGQIGGTTQKWIGQLMDTFRGGGGGHLTSPTDPRFWGLKGRPHSDRPGEGLVIDMRK